MGNIIVIFLKWILNNFFDTELDDIDINFNMGFDTLANHTLMIEKSIGLTGSTFNPEAILNYIMGFAVVLIVLKFLKKGFDKWIAWTDDPSSDPLQLTTNFVKALVCALTFPILYGWLVDVIEDLTTGIMNVMGIGGMTSLSDTLRSMIDTAGFTMIIFILIYLVLIIMLYMKFLMRGAEIFIVRMGFPLACVGIIDANGGVFSGYVNKLFQIVLSVTVQVVLCKLSLSFMIGGHLIWAIVFAITAVNSPRILQELIYNPGGGGGGGITQTYYIAQMIKGLAKKG